MIYIAKYRNADKSLRREFLVVETELKVIKLFFMLNSVEHEILNTHKYENNSGSDKLGMLFFLLINVKMPTIVGILTFMSRKNFMLN